jgi:hypothetical protein
MIARSWSDEEASPAIWPSRLETGWASRWSARSDGELSHHDLGIVDPKVALGSGTGLEHQHRPDLTADRRRQAAERGQKMQICSLDLIDDTARRDCAAAVAKRLLDLRELRIG